MSRFTDVLGAANGLDSPDRVRLISHLICSSELHELEIVPVAWFQRLAELAKADPFAAGRLAAAMYQHLAAHRPESPAPLDAGFKPTEPERDPRSKP